jgi:flagellar biosynthetic protein FliR
MIETFLISQVFALFLIFCRIGSAIMILPVFGEAYIPPLVRLTLAFMVSLLLVPLLGSVIPPLPASPLSLALIVASEITTGIFIGAVCNILISATHIAGMIFSFQSGMSSAVIYDVTQSSQGSLIGNLMGLLTITLLFTTGLHHLMLRGITESYAVFIPGHWPPLHDFVETAVRIISDTFIIAVQVSTPLLVIGTLLFLGAGILSRLMPTMQVFFVITPPQLLICIFILTTTFSAIMLWYMEFYREKLMMIFGYVK